MPRKNHPKVLKETGSGTNKRSRIMFILTNQTVKTNTQEGAASVVGNNQCHTE